MKRILKTRALTSEAIQSIAEEAYVYGYPLVLMDTIRRAHTSVPFPTAEGAPVNQFAHTRFSPVPHAKGGLRADADSLRSTASLDLSSEPIILSIPPTDRFYLLSLWSAWGDLFDAISPRTTKTENARFAIVAPDWRGRLPAGVIRINAPTETIWINGRFQAAGPEDIQLVHGVQDQFRLTPLREWGNQSLTHTTPVRLNIEKHTTPHDEVASLAAPGFYSRLSKLIKRNPPHECDASIIGRLSQIGFHASQNFMFESLPPSTVWAMHAAVPAAQLKIVGAAKASSSLINNWALTVSAGCFETNYLSRAVVASNGFWNCRGEDVVAFESTLDDSSKILKGTNQYVIHFKQEDIPPVNAFWSITLYDSKLSFPANAIHRHVIGDRDRLRLNSDNSLSIYLQHEWPGTAKDSNWLPTPSDTFALVFQLYWPKPEVLNGIWRPPAVMREH